MGRTNVEVFVVDFEKGNIDVIQCPTHSYCVTYCYSNDTFMV